MKIDFMKKLQALFKEAGVPMPEQAGDAHPLKSHADKLAASIAAYGDGAGLAADHPLHALKALHKEMTDSMTADAEKAAKAAEPKEEEDDVTKTAIAEEVTKALAPVHKALEAANARADAAEAVAKGERDKNAIEVEKTNLRKFRHVAVDVEKDAALFAKMRATDQPTYDFMIGKLNAAEEVAKAAAALGRDLGSPLGGAGQTAWAEIEAKAGEMVTKSADGLTIEKAIDKVMQQHPELVKRYKAEQAGSPS